MNFDNISDILSGMSEEDFANLSGMAEQLLGNSTKQEEQTDVFGGIDPQMIAKIMQLLPLLQNKGDDERSRLIAALKPLLSPKRRRKADEALQLMHLLEIMPLIEKLM